MCRAAGACSRLTRGLLGASRLPLGADLCPLLGRSLLGCRGLRLLHRRRRGLSHSGLHCWGSCCCLSHCLQPGKAEKISECVTHCQFFRDSSRFSPRTSGLGTPCLARKAREGARQPCRARQGQKGAEQPARGPRSWDGKLFCDVKPDLRALTTALLPPLAPQGCRGVPSGPPRQGRRGREAAGAEVEARKYSLLSCLNPSQITLSAPACSMPAPARLPGHQGHPGAREAGQAHGPGARETGQRDPLLTNSNSPQKGSPALLMPWDGRCGVAGLCLFP